MVVLNKDTIEGMLNGNVSVSPEISGIIPTNEGTRFIRTIISIGDTTANNEAALEETMSQEMADEREDTEKESAEVEGAEETGTELEGAEEMGTELEGIGETGTELEGTGETGTELDGTGETTPNDDVPKEILPFLSNNYVAYYKDGKLFYTAKFHQAMYELLQKGYSAKDAYDALGFDTKTLGYDRAYGAAKRAMEKARKGILYVEVVEEEQLAESEDKVEEPTSKQEEPDWVKDVEKNVKYVKRVSHGRIHYTDEFYVEMAQLLEEGKTATQAYEALGFDVTVLGADRAFQSAAYAVKKAEKIKRPIVGTNGADGTISFEETMEKMGATKLDPNNPELAAAAFARVLFLETVLESLKKKPAELGGKVYEFYDEELTLNTLQLVDQIMDNQMNKLGLTKDQILIAFKIPASTYYSYKQRLREEEKKKKEKEEKKRKKKKEELRTMNQIKEIVKLLGGNCPGAKRMRIYLIAMYDNRIGKKKCAALMRKMNFVGNPHWKDDQKKGLGSKVDPYKGNATHIHPALAKYNLVNQDFLKGPRSVVLTDITYVPYASGTEMAYHCQFFDPFTNQTLGEATSQTMDVAMVKVAYDDMMAKHKKEFGTVLRVFIHSDQGSQYCATSFQKLLSSDKFIQSMSRRATPTDNAPMEARFSRLKDEVGNLLYYCKDFESVKKLISNYLVHHDENHIYLCLAGLTPNQYYDYYRTGIYPLKEYFGVDKEHFSTPEEILEERRKRAKENAEKNRKRYEKYKKNLEDLEKDVTKEIDPNARVAKDLAIIIEEEDRIISGNVKLSELASKLTALKGMVAHALSFLHNASKEVLDKLKDYQNWKNYEELNYVNEMTELGLC